MNKHLATLFIKKIYDDNEAEKFIKCDYSCNCNNSNACIYALYCFLFFFFT